MAVSTIVATIQMRHGLEVDLDSDQLTVGEWAVSEDTKYVRMCFAPGFVLRMATYEGFEQDMQEIQLILATCQNIQAAVDTMANLAEQHKNDAEKYAKLSESWAHGDTGVRDGESDDNSKFWSNQAKSEADRAKSEADRASSIVNLDIDSELSETSSNPVQNKVIANALKEIDVDINDKSINFEEAKNRTNIQNGEKLPILFGKIKKWFSDLKDAAFYDVVNNVTQTEAGQSVLDAAVGKWLDEHKLDKDKVVESVNITEPGFVMGGKTASDEFSKINKGFTNEKGRKDIPSSSNTKIYTSPPLDAGLYLINASGAYDVSSSASITMTININTTAGSAVRTTMAGGGQMSLSYLASLSAGDTIGLSTFHANTATSPFKYEISYVRLR